MPSPFKIIVGLLIAILSITAVLPLLGYHLNLYEVRLVRVEDIPTDYASLLVIRSACFSTLAYFGLNYLRRKRPLSSVEPLSLIHV